MKPRLETPEEAHQRLDAEQLSSSEQARLWQRLDASTSLPRPSPRRALVMGFALAATALAAALLFFARGQDTPKVEAKPIASACDVDPSQTELRLGEGCGERTLQVESDDWRLQAGTELVRVESGARVKHGRVQFRVRPREASPFRVQVSHGEVRVIGTVFTVEQRAGRGFVAVTEGVIEFVWNDGSRERVGAGQTLHWPRQSKPETLPAPAPSASEKQTVLDAGKPDAGKNGARPPEDMDQTLDRLLQLRSQKRYAEAAALLEKAMSSGGISAAQQERLSYELGLAMEAGGNGACAHWKKHVKRFGTGRHPKALTQRLERCRAE